MLSEIRCKNCNRLILRKSGDGFVRVTSKVIKSNQDGTGVIAVCKVCNSEQEVPLVLSMPPLSNEDSLVQKGPFRVRSQKTAEKTLDSSKTVK